MESQIYIIIFLSIVIIALQLYLIFFKKNDKNIESKLDLFSSSLNRIEGNLKEDFRVNREESNNLAKENRDELNNTLKDFKKEISENLKTITEQNQNALEKLTNTLELKVSALIDKTEQNAKDSSEQLANSIKEFSETNSKALEKISKQVEDKLKDLNDQAKSDALLMRSSLEHAFKGFGVNFEKSINSFNELQKEKFTDLEKRQNDLILNTENKLESIRVTVEEKLEKTLSERLGHSFETVGKQLIEVQKGLGEMQTIAADVGGLKKVLSNVKLRGGVGEVQLAMLLEQILAPNQYEANVKTKKGSSDSVEFAIKLPGKSDDENSVVYLPIDAKFPKDTYEYLINAYENAIPEEIETATKNLEVTIKKMAKDISDKYIDPPNTTDFAIMFLPFESIYAEVIRRSALVDQLRDQYKITVAGPTTLMAILNSLQMGFRTLSIQKRSSEVWNILSTVKKEFGNFGGLLEKAQKNIQTGLGQLDQVAGTRTRAIQRQLQNVETIPTLETKNIGPEIIIDAIDEIIEK
jgi:DNA recombination protein RmuC